MPAATVSFVASSTSTNAPVVRLSAYGWTRSGLESQPHTSDVVELQPLRRDLRERADVELRLDRVEDRARPPCRVLDPEPGPDLHGALAHPAVVASSVRAATG